MQDGYFLIALDRLYVGATVEYPILGCTGNVLLPIQSAVTLDFLFACQRSGQRIIQIHRHDLERWGIDCLDLPASDEQPIPQPNVSRDDDSHGGTSTMVRRTEQVVINRREIRLVQPELREFAEELLSRSATWPASDRRREFRCAAATPVAVVAIRDDGEPEGPPFEAILRDISTNGAAFLYHRSLPYQQFVIELKSHRRGRVQVLFERTRCVPAGNYFDFGGRLVTCLTD